MTAPQSNPQKTFHDTGIDARLADALASKGIVHPFPIQELTLPMALKGADIIGQARTGTGKTLGFGLPLLHRVDPDRRHTQALVVVPTRELCVQVASDLEIGSVRGVTSIAVYGGVPIEPQTEALIAGVHVVVGTPGRLLDHLNRGNLDLSQVSEMVLDEADEMLDMGFLPDVERLLDATPQEGRHTMLFSATMPSTIVSLARRYMSHPTFMRAETEESDVAPTVDQHFLLVHRMDKPRVLARILQSPDRGGVYVFTRTKHMADRLVNELEELGVAAIAIHGDLRQTTRQKNLDRFRDGEADVLVATEVAARGLDVENVSHVVNYDCPDDEKMYLHRIGRTARAGARGVAVTFAEFNEVDRMNVIRKAVGATDTAVEEVFSTSDRLTEIFDLPEERPWDHLARRAKGSGGSGGKRKGGGRDDKRSSGTGDGRRKGSSDGRPKNDRRTEGRGERSSSRRDRPRETAAATSEPAPTATPEATTGSSGSAGDDDPSTSTTTGRRSSSRARTRDGETRSRRRTRATTDAGGGRGTAADLPAAPTEPTEPAATPAADTGGEEAPARTQGGDRGRGGGSGATRTRARRRATTAAPADDRGSSRGRDRDTDRSDGRGADRPTGAGKDDDRAGHGRDRAEARSDDARPDRSGDDRRGGRSGDTRGSRSRSGRRSGERADGGDRGAAAPGGTGPGQEPTRRGPDARGDGSPQLARRVRVEHLP